MKKTIILIISLTAGLFLFASLLSGCSKQSATSNTTTKPTNDQSSSTKITKDKKATSKEVTIKITKDGFEPKELTIKTGDTVFWKNESGADAQIHLEELGEQSDVIANGASAKRKFDSARSNSYHNHLNSSMAGTVTVE